ncbi:hypothetical protein XH93_42090 [Bradyrhizobium sp. CCBAU 51753]|nr:hypothetical protein XH93_42090 [Bradyrhizobium sp. CCBAU 51753]
MTLRELLMHIVLESDWKIDRHKSQRKFFMKIFWYCTAVCDTQDSVRRFMSLYSRPCIGSSATVAKSRDLRRIPGLSENALGVIVLLFATPTALQISAV